MLALTLNKSALDNYSSTRRHLAAARACSVEYPIKSGSRVSDRIPLMGDRAYVYWGALKEERLLDQRCYTHPAIDPARDRTNAFMSLVQVAGPTIWSLCHSRGGTVPRSKVSRAQRL